MMIDNTTTELYEIDVTQIVLSVVCPPSTYLKIGNAEAITNMINCR